MSSKGWTYKRCGCTDPETGKQLGEQCPELPSRRHGAWSYEIRLDTTTGRRQLKRGGFGREKDAASVLDAIGELVKLARDDDRARKRIGDLIFEKTKRGGQLPELGDVRRRLGLRREDLGSSEAFAMAWEAYLAGKRKAKRPSYVNSLEQIGRNWLLPVLAEIPVDRITGEHCLMVFERLDMLNEEIEAAREEKRAPVLPGDVRDRKQYTGVATQHRIYAALRNFLNRQWKKLHVIPFNPVFAVELAPETREAALVWTPDQVACFLDFTADDRLAFLWRLALLRGFRRGELAGMADGDMDVDAAAITVNVALLLIGGKLSWGKPKSRAGERVVGLDSGSVAAGRAHRARRKRDRLAAGASWQESGHMFTRPDGQPLNPDYISRRFRELTDEAGLPRIKFHGTRHTAATLALEAKIDTRIVSEQLGHSTTRITQDLYQHVRVQLQIDAAEQTVALLPERKARQEAGS